MHWLFRGRSCAPITICISARNATTAKIRKCAIMPFVEGSWAVFYLPVESRYPAGNCPSLDKKGKPVGWRLSARKGAYIMFTPENEIGVIVEFSQRMLQFDLEIVSIGSKFPDAILRHTKTEDEYRTEFEFLASNFIEHGHDPRHCDLIVCWINDYRDCFLPVIELSKDTEFHPRATSEIEREVMYLRVQNAGLKREVNSLRQPKLILPQPNQTNIVDSQYAPPPGEGWRIETHGRSWVWRKGSGKNRQSVYGGLMSNLPIEIKVRYQKRGNRQ